MHLKHSRGLFECFWIFFSYSCFDSLWFDPSGIAYFLAFVSFLFPDRKEGGLPGLDTYIFIISFMLVLKNTGSLLLVTKKTVILMILNMLISTYPNSSEFNGATLKRIWMTGSCRLTTNWSISGLIGSQYSSTLKYILLYSEFHYIRSRSMF